MLQWIEGHGIELIIAYYIFNAVVSGMPEPMPNGNAFYLWLYRSSHTLSGNIDRVMQTTGKVPKPGAPPNPPAA